MSSSLICVGIGTNIHVYTYTHMRLHTQTGEVSKPLEHGASVKFNHFLLVAELPWGLFFGIVNPMALGILLNRFQLQVSLRARPSALPQLYSFTLPCRYPTGPPPPSGKPLHQITVTLERWSEKYT